MTGSKISMYRWALCIERKMALAAVVCRVAMTKRSSSAAYSTDVENGETIVRTFTARPDGDRHRRKERRQNESSKRRIGQLDEETRRSHSQRRHTKAAARRSDGL